MAFDGLEIAGSGKSLLSGLYRVYKWKIEGSVDYDSGNVDKGILFSMSPSWSSVDSDVEQFIWNSELAVISNDAFISTGNQRFEAEIGYVIIVWDGKSVFTPYGGVALSQNEDSEFSLGSKLGIGTAIQFELEGSRTNQNMGINMNRVKLNSAIKW